MGFQHILNFDNEGSTDFQEAGFLSITMPRFSDKDYNVPFYLLSKPDVWHYSSEK